MLETTRTIRNLIEISRELTDIVDQLRVSIVRHRAEVDRLRRRVEALEGAPKLARKRVSADDIDPRWEALGNTPGENDR